MESQQVVMHVCRQTKISLIHWLTSGQASAARSSCRTWKPGAAARWDMSDGILPTVVCILKQHKHNGTVS